MSIPHSDVPNTLTPAEARKLFPIAEHRIYLNNASIGALSEPVLAALQAFQNDIRDNGRNNYPDWCVHVDGPVKERIGRLLGAHRDEIAYIKNTTEGLITVANGLDWREGDNVVLPDIEYPSNVYCWMRLKKLAVETRLVPTRGGRVLVDDLAAACDERTRLITVSAVQFSNGYRADLAALSQLCKERNILLNLDMIQWAGSLHMDLSKYNVNFASAGSHKGLLASIGSGIFYCRKDSLDLLDPPNVGYHSTGKSEAHMDYELVYRPDAGRFEEALVNMPGIWGLDAAVRMQLAIGSKVIEDHILSLIRLATERLKSRGYTIVSPGTEPHEQSSILTFSPPGQDTDAVVARMREAGIDIAPRAGVLRMSPSYFNSADEILAVVEAL